MGDRRMRATCLVGAVLSAAAGNASAQVKELPDTLPPYQAVKGEDADSSKSVEAASDALQGQNGLTVPMVVKVWKRQAHEILIELAPVQTPTIVWRNLGGTVRILADGRRVILERK